MDNMDILNEKNEDFNLEKNENLFFEKEEKNESDEAIGTREIKDMFEESKNSDDYSFDEYLSFLEGPSEDAEYSKVSTTVFITEFSGDVQSPEDCSNSDNFKSIFAHETSAATLKFLATSDEFIMVDLHFFSGLGVDLALIQSNLLQWAESVTKYLRAETDVITSFSINFASEEFMGDSFASFENPIFWAIMPEISGGTNLNVLRLAFKRESCEIVKIGDDLDLNEIVEELAYEDRFNSENDDYDDGFEEDEENE